jgi:hypothetical protein
VSWLALGTSAATWHPPRTFIMILQASKCFASHSRNVLVPGDRSAGVGGKGHRRGSNQVLVDNDLPNRAV